MTELYIAGELVVLPESFSITIIEENPFFTKNGKYSYDITLSLLNPTNAKIYKHLNRKNNTIAPLKNRTAYLKVDNEVVLNGTEVILEHTDKVVKIQLVSGNSELNFLIGGDLKLRDLDLGKAEPYIGSNWLDVAAKVYKDLNKTYPERNWHLLPYATGYDTNLYADARKQFLKIGNLFVTENENRIPSEYGPNISIPCYQPSYSGQVPQPYLCFIIRKVIEAIGYKLEYSAIENDNIRKNMYIVHGRRTNDFAKMLPNWTVLEFFENIELFFDAVIIIDPFTRSLSIHYKYEAINDTLSKVELDILDEFNMEYDETSEQSIQLSNIEYDLDDDDYYTYMSLNPKIRRCAPRMAVQSLDVLREMVESVPSSSLLFDYIYTIGRNEGEYIAYKIKDKVTIKKVEAFKPLKLRDKNSDEIDISLKIIPASFLYVVNKTFGSVINFPYSSFYVQLPVTEDYDDLSDGNSINDQNDESIILEKIGNIQEAVENGLDSENESIGGTKMRLAIYDGLKPMNILHINPDSGVEAAYYPMSYVESLYEDFPDSKTETYMTKNNYNPFRLDVINKDIYNQSNKIDKSKTYKLSFLKIGKYNISSVFIANNKKYSCAKIERVVTENGFEKIAKGEFYPL